MEKQILKKLEDIETKIVFNGKDILNISEACLFLGVSRSYLYKLTSSNKLSYYKPNGKVLFFHKKDLITWMTRNKVKSNDELSNDVNIYVSNNLR